MRKIRTVIPPMDVQGSLAVSGASVDVVYQANKDEYYPDYRLTPLVVQLKYQKREGSGNYVNATIAEVKLYEYVNNNWVLVSSSAAVTIDTVNAKVTFNTHLTQGVNKMYKLEGKISDSRRALSVPISELFTLTCSASVSSHYRAVPSYEHGSIIDVVSPLSSYQLSCQLKLGDSATPAHYRWYRGDVEIISSNANGITGIDSAKITIPYAQLGIDNIFKCVCYPSNGESSKPTIPANAYRHTFKLAKRHPSVVGRIVIKSQTDTHITARYELNDNRGTLTNASEYFDFAWTKQMTDGTVAALGTGQEITFAIAGISAIDCNEIKK